MILRLLIVVVALSLGGCWGLAGDDEMSRYLQRSDTITMSAGDAKQVNAVTHTITPWPRYVQDRRIATDARRTGAAVTRYKDSDMPNEPLPPITDAGRPMGRTPGPTTNQNINVTGPGAGAAGINVGAR